MLPFEIFFNIADSSLFARLVGKAAGPEAPAARAASYAKMYAKVSSFRKTIGAA